MKILIIDDNGVKEFAPINLKEDNQQNTKSFIELLKESLLIEQKTTKNDELNLFTISKLAQLFNTTRPTLYSWIDNGDLKPIKIGGRVYFNKKDIEEMLDRKTSQSSI